jgi:hypothetical protein
VLVVFRWLDGELIFKLEEEVNMALLLLLPALFAETTVFGSASWMRCRVVVETSQAAVFGKVLSDRISN